MARPDKIAAVEALCELFQQAHSVVLNDFTGLNVEKLSHLRKLCRENKIEYRVIKNTLAIRSIQGTAVQALEEFFEGPTAVALSRESENLPAKILAEFASENEAPRFKAALIGGELLEADQVMELAKLPTREELIAAALGRMKSPLNNLVFLLHGVLRKFLYAMNAIIEKKQSEDGLKGQTPKNGC